VEKPEPLKTEWERQTVTKLQNHNTVSHFQTQLAKKRQSARPKPPKYQKLKNAQRIYLQIYEKQFSNEAKNSGLVAHFGVFLPAGKPNR